MSNYIKGLFHGLGTLLTGMKVTGREFFTPKVTEQYPENRATLKMYDRFCGTLTMPHDAEGRNRCIACGLCVRNCPNEAIFLKDNVAAIDYTKCNGCGTCVSKCPKKAIQWVEGAPRPIDAPVPEHEVLKTRV